MIISAMQSYMAVLEYVLDETGRITSEVAREASKNNFWITAKAWKLAFGEYRSVRDKISMHNPPAMFKDDHERLVSAYNDLVISTDMMVTSINFETHEVDNILFNTGQGKMLIAEERKARALNELIEKVKWYKTDN